MKYGMWIVVVNFLAHWTLTDAQVRNIWIWISYFDIITNYRQKNRALPKDPHVIAIEIT